MILQARQTTFFLFLCGRIYVRAVVVCETGACQEQGRQLVQRKRQETERSREGGRERVGAAAVGSGRVLELCCVCSGAFCVTDMRDLQMLSPVSALLHG